jgi:gas vesicle protein
MDSEKVLLGFLAGVAVGATLGILFAPDKGSNTRKKIASKSNEYADELGEKFNELVESMNNKFDSLKEDVVRTSEDGQLRREDAELTSASY